MRQVRAEGRIEERGPGCREDGQGGDQKDRPVRRHQERDCEHDGTASQVGDQQDQATVESIRDGTRGNRQKDVGNQADGSECADKPGVLRLAVDHDEDGDVYSQSPMPLMNSPIKSFVSSRLASSCR